MSSVVSSQMGDHLFFFLLLVSFSTAIIHSNQGQNNRESAMEDSGQERSTLTRSSPEGTTTHDKREDIPMGHRDALPLHMMPSSASSFPVVAKVINGEEDKGQSMDTVTHSSQLLSMHSYKKGPKVEVQQEEEECPYCPSGNCPYCRGNGDNGKTVQQYQQEKCPDCPSGKCPWCHGKTQSSRKNEEEKEGGDCPNCPSGQCPWCHGKNQPTAHSNGPCANCPSGKCPWCQGKNRRVQQEDDEYEDDDQNDGQQCLNCPSGKCPWCHGKNKNNAVNSYSDYSKVQKGEGDKVATNEDEQQGQCPNCPSGRCPWCGGPLSVNGQCRGCPDGKCPWCHRNLETEEDGSRPSETCPNCPSGKCPWCHGKKESGQTAPITYSAYNNQPNEKSPTQEEREHQNEECANCPSGRCPWCGGALTKNGKCVGCPDGKCPWCHRNLETGEGPEGVPSSTENQCPNCPSGKCPWCHGKNQLHTTDAPAAQHKGYNNGQSGGCPYCPSGQCPWCHGKNQPAAHNNGKGEPQQPQTEVEYEYEDEPQEQTTVHKGSQEEQTPSPVQPVTHYGPPPGYQPQTPNTYAKVQMPIEKNSQKGQLNQPTVSNQQKEEEYEYEEGQPQYGVHYGAIVPSPSVANYQSPGPAPTASVKFRTGITSAPVGSAVQSHWETPSGVSQSRGVDGCCVISLPPGRYQILPAAKAKARRKRSTDNFRRRFLLRD